MYDLRFTTGSAFPIGYSIVFRNLKVRFSRTHNKNLSCTKNNVKGLRFGQKNKDQVFH